MLNNTNLTTQFQTGYPYIGMPQKLRDVIAQMIRQHNSKFRCSSKPNWGDCWIEGNCTSFDPIPLNFTFGIEGSNATFTIPISNLMQYHKTTNQCVLEIATLGDIEENALRIGEPFFRSFYSVFDNTNKRIGLGLSAISPLGSTIVIPQKPGPKPGPDVYNPHSVWNIWTQLLIILLLILIALILSLLCYMRHLKKINESERDAQGAVSDNRS